MKYEHQLIYKQKLVTDNFQRLGKFDFPEPMPILGSENTEFYRNKLEFTFSNRRWFTDFNKDEVETRNPNGLGFHLPKMFDRILDIDKCFLQDDLSNRIRRSIRDFAIQNNYSFYDVKKWEGLLRNLIIRNTSTGEWMVIVIFRHVEEEAMNNILSHIRDNFPEITSLLYVINGKRNDDISDQKVEMYYGRHFIMEEMESYDDPKKKLKFNIGPLSFFQTNTKQATILYKTAVEFANLSGNETVYDLYTGTGTIANYIAANTSKVVGIEYIESAIEDAKVNSMINEISNTSFFAGDILKVLNDDFIEENGKPDVIITDPPRAGMHEKVVRKLMEIAPDRIVYVSCNPATQARDISLMVDKYEIKKVQPVDMFPHTQHVENVVLLERKMQ